MWPSAAVVMCDWMALMLLKKRMYLLFDGSRDVWLFARTAKRSRCLFSLLMYMTKGMQEGHAAERRHMSAGVRCTPSTIRLRFADAYEEITEKS